MHLIRLCSFWGPPQTPSLANFLYRTAFFSTARGAVAFSLLVDVGGDRFAKIFAAMNMSGTVAYGCDLCPSELTFRAWLNRRTLRATLVPSNSTCRSVHEDGVKFRSAT